MPIEKMISQQVMDFDLRIARPRMRIGKVNDGKKVVFAEKNRTIPLNLRY